MQARAGGEEAPTPLDAPAKPAPAKPATPAPAAPALTKSDVTPRRDDGCGGYTWEVKWALSGATEKTNGFVVQEVRWLQRRTHCEVGRFEVDKTYWEAWEVRGGKVYAGTSDQLHEADVFTNGPATDEKGVNRQEGRAKFIEGYEAPRKWGRVHEAKDLPATERKPDGWSSAGTLERHVVSTFDCCGKTPTSKVEGKG